MNLSALLFFFSLFVVSYALAHDESIRNINIEANNKLFVVIPTRSLSPNLTPQKSCKTVKNSSHLGSRTITLEHGLNPCATTHNNLTWSDVIRQTLDRDSKRGNRMLKPASEDIAIDSGSKLNTGNYIASVGFGTPTKTMRVTIDTGSDITWIQCQPCTTCYEEADPIFITDTSTTYKAVPCHSKKCRKLADTEDAPSCHTGTCQYEVRYGDGSKTEGDFATETLTVGKETFQGFLFGCGHDNSGKLRGSDGLLGLGRGSLAFPAQTRSRYRSQFSYCLPDFGDVDSSGTLSIGAGSIPSGAIFTPLVSVPEYPTYYMVGLEAITVGRYKITMPTVSTIVDSGTIISRLVPDVYKAVKAAFKKQTTSLVYAPGLSVFDTCYDLSKVKQIRVPKIAFHYKGNAVVDVSSVGLLFAVKSDLSQVCLAFASASDGIDFNIVGNFQQQRMRVAYDGRRRRLGFLGEQCSPSR